MGKRPIISIVIPTYNRYQYLYDCVDTIREVESEELEIVIQDNTADNIEFSAYIEKLNDPRIKYYHKKEHVSVVENCDMGISHATGDYVCLIGDDDTICSSLIKACHYLKDNNIEGCCFPFPGFNWPDMTFENGHKAEANMFFQVKADGVIKKMDPRTELRKNVCQCDLAKMPHLYHAIVARRCLERIFKKLGTYTPGPSPDMATGVAVSLEIENAVYLSDYLIVSGYGKSSSRGEGNRNEHFGNIEEKFWLPKDTIKKWNPNIPCIFSAETILAQSAWLALRSMGKERDYPYYYSDLYATFFWHHKNVKTEFLKFVLKSPRKTIWFVEGVIKRALMKFLGHGVSSPNYLEFNDVKTLQEAKRLTEEISKDIYYHTL